MIATSSLNMVNSLCHPLGGWCDANALLLIQIKCSYCLQMTMGANRLMNILGKGRFVCEESINGGSANVVLLLCPKLTYEELPLGRLTGSNWILSLHGNEVAGNGRQDCSEILFKR